MMIVRGIVILTLISAVFSQNPYTFDTKFIDVPVDHFSFTDNQTFKLRYLVNSQFWIDDGPIFFYTGNEGDIETFAQNTGFIFNLAPTFNALIVFAEHRYYGKSLPFGNDSFSSPSKLGYLSSTQALADYVFLIDELQQQYNPSHYVDKLAVIAFGGSYGGMLAAWLRMKYPASVIGSIASSAPIWQFKDLTPCGNFYKIVTNVYQYSTEEDCSEPIRRSWPTIRSLMGTAEGRTLITNEWKICETLQQNQTDILVGWLNEIIVNMAMVNYPYETSFLAPLPPNPVRNFCEILMKANITSDNKTLISAIGSALQIYTNYTGSTKCNSIDKTSGMIDESTWNFQACTEIIMPMCSTDEDMFETAAWNFDQFEADCSRQFKISQKRENFPILEYGGKDLSAASNIVFSNGLLDPWSSGGVLSNVSRTVSAVVIPEGAHHLDLRAENPQDPESVVEARKFHENSIQGWIQNFYSKNFEKKYLVKNVTDIVVNNL